MMNALYLMLSTFVVAATGFLFWVVVARGYDAATVGLATTLLSVSGLLSLLGLAGFDTTFVRFLPKSDNKNDYINSGFIVATLASAGLAVCLGFVLPLLSPSLSVLYNPWVFVSFIFFTTVTSLNVLTNAVFLAFKQARYILIINTLFSLLKLMLPLLVAGKDAITIFVMAGIAQLFGLMLSIVWMRRKFNYIFSPIIHMDTLRSVRKFSLSVYASSILNLLPPALLPLIILYRIGAENAAYYYMAFTIAGALYVIVYASMQSVLAEGSHNETAIRSHIAAALKLISALLLPAVLLIVLLSNTLLAVFGAEYAKGASTLLRLFAVGALPLATYSALSTTFKVTKNLRGVVSMNIVYALVILGLSDMWVSHFGLVAIGWAWVIGNIAACGVGAIFLIKK